MSTNKITNLGTPTNEFDTATRGYVDSNVAKLTLSEESPSGTTSSTASILLNSIKVRNVSTTMSSPGTGTTLLSSITKTPTKGKLKILSMWLERSANEWFNVDNSTVISGGHPNFQVIYSDSNKDLFAWFNGTKGTAWSGRIRANFLELP